MTFADAAEIVRDGDSGRSRMITIDLGKMSGERLHPKAVY